MQIKPQHHMSILQRQDRILTGNFDMRILEYQMGFDSRETMVQTNGVDIAINYSGFTPLLNPRILAASNGANVHALAHNLRTPRIEAHMLDAFNSNGPRWRQAFNIAEDWRVECHIVDDSHIAGPMLASMFAHVTGSMNSSPRNLFILTAGRLYLADAGIVGDKHVEYMRTLRDVAAYEETHSVEVRMLEHISQGRPVMTAEKIIFDSHTDLHHLAGVSWANAVVEHAILYHDKLWSMRHLGHPVNDTYLLGSQMCKIIERIMVLIGPDDRRETGTTPDFDVWQDVTFLFDQANGGDGSPEHSPGNGSPPPPGDSPPSDDGNGEDEGDSEESPGRGGSFGDGMFNEDCRCGTCGR